MHGLSVESHVYPFALPLGPLYIKAIWKRVGSQGAWKWWVQFIGWVEVVAAIRTRSLVGVHVQPTISFLWWVSKIN